MELADLVYDVIDDIPWQKGQKVIDQMSSASLSIPSNIAEGNSRRSEKDKHRFIEYALGSAFELETQLIFSARREWSTVQKIDRALELCRTEQKMLMYFMDVLEK